ncbi:DUF1659 domain-containing protein [Bacillaceae bacterium W0354]
MANETKFKTQLQLVLHVGDGEDGEAIIKRKSYSQVNPEATAEQLHAVSQALANLQPFPLISIVRNDSSEINAY